MRVDISSIQLGWDVLSSDERRIGGVTAVRGDYLVAGRGVIFSSDTYVPLDAVVDIEGDTVYLSVREDELDQLGWRYGWLDDTSEPPSSLTRLKPGSETATSEVRLDHGPELYHGFLQPAVPPDPTSDSIPKWTTVVSPPASDAGGQEAGHDLNADPSNDDNTPAGDLPSDTNAVTPQERAESPSSAPTTDPGTEGYPAPGIAAGSHYGAVDVGRPGMDYGLGAQPDTGDPAMTTAHGTHESDSESVPGEGMLTSRGTGSETGPNTGDR